MIRKKAMSFLPPTREAVELALQMGEQSPKEILFLSVIGDDEGSDGEACDDPQAQAVLDHLLSDAADRGVNASVKLIYGRAWYEIIREALRSGTDLVIVGSRDHKTRELLLGTTGTKLLRKCPCPVWVARPGASADPPTVLIADDLTEVGGHAVQLGVSAAQMMDAKLMIVHAVQSPLESSLRRTECPPEEISEYRDKCVEEAKQGISDHLAQTDYRTLNYGVGVEATHGPPDVVILNAIEEHSADLLVMGTIARTGIPGLLVGNTAERLLPDVSCSVLAVKPEGFESPVRLD